MVVSAWAKGACLGLALVLAGGTLSGAEVPPVITIAADRGDVTFRHLAHQLRTRGCHSDNGSSASPLSCTGCHG